MKNNIHNFKEINLIDTKKYFDSRGYFFESYNSKNYNKLFRERCNFVQDNISFSKKNVLRGLHFQKKYPQAKLLTVLKGRIIDVVVDIRKNSKSYGKYQKFLLSDKSGNQIYIPKGFAHGFLALSKQVIISYKCSNYYDPNDQNTIIWNDRDLNIDWGIKKPILSKKDKKGIEFRDLV